MQDKVQESVDLKQCRKALNAFCKGTYRMCVPAQPDDDDMVLSRALNELEAARAEIERLKAENTRVVASSGAGYEKLIDALKYYANEMHYAERNIDWGKRAREVLKAVGVME